MKILQIGAGSMGKRRLRDLSARGDCEITLLENREDRRKAAAERFGVRTFDHMDDALDWKPDTMIISTGPLTHRLLLKTAMDNGLNCFCECSLFGHDFIVIERVSNEKGLVIVPSLTLWFYPMVEPFKNAVFNDIGTLYYYMANQSFYVPDWHPGETSDEFYALNRTTAAAREITAYNITLLDNIFDSTPVEVTGTVMRRGSLDIDSEDTWCLQMRLSDGASGQINTTMASKFTHTTFIMAVGENGMVRCDLYTGDMQRILPDRGIDDVISVGPLMPMIEDVYAKEINTFIDVIEGKAVWPTSYRAQAHAAATLAAAEKSALKHTVEKVDLNVMPAGFPDEY